MRTNQVAEMVKTSHRCPPNQAQQIALQITLQIAVILVQESANIQLNYSWMFD